MVFHFKGYLSMFTTHQYPFSVFPGQGFASGLGHFDQNNMLNNDIRSPTFPFHPHLQPSFPVVNVPSHPPNFTQQSSSSFNPFSVNHLTTQRVPPVVTGNTLGSTEQPSTSFAATTPGHRWLHHHWTTKGMFPLLTVLARLWGFFFMTTFSRPVFILYHYFIRKVKFLVLEFK